MSKRIVIKSIEQYKKRLERHRQYYVSKLKANDEQHKLRMERRRQYVLKLKQHLESQHSHHLQHKVSGSVEQCKKHQEMQECNAKHSLYEISEHKELVKDQQMKEYEGIASKRHECCSSLKNVQKYAIKDTIIQDKKSEDIHHEPVKIIKTEPNNQGCDSIYHNIESCGKIKPNVHDVSKVVPESDLSNGVNSNDLQTKNVVHLCHENQVRKHLKMETNIATEGIQGSTLNEEKYFSIDNHVKEVIKDVQLKPSKYYLKGDTTAATNIGTINDYTEKKISIKIEPLDE